MSVVRLPKDRAESAAVSGSGMDRVIERRRFPKPAIIGGIVAIVLAAALLFWWLAPRAGTQSVAAERLSIATVTRGTFDDYIPLRTRVEPLLTVFIDAIEGGRVEEVLVEDGANLAKGQPIAVLSNAELQLSTLARQTEVEQQINNMRSQELALAQTRVTNQRNVIEAELAMIKARRQYELEAPLARKGFVAGRQFADTGDQLSYEQRRVAVLRQGQATDDRLLRSQLAQQRASTGVLEAGLQLARANLEALKLRAPVAGQLSGFSIQVGQSMQRGERIGQIDSPGRNKLRAGVDEYYLGRVAVGQKATIENAGKAQQARVTKIFPQVQNGQFQIELQFLTAEPAGLQRGQTVQARLTLGDPAPAVLLPNGAFYNDTGGAWVFVVAPDGSRAMKRTVRLGRRNTDTIEVLDGLTAGERVITSPYTGFADKDALDLTGKES
ncbi:efflux RND transporter periplasmic adaptor subunit [Sphingomonas radiodurans]|uniref:efflux RND transporter periplasmic adaptor subunit n=1 Tax=Sphingomonas radiodurans TaxID=2890321 RepID=UPI001E37A6F1|nr:efflux RND transporter periplasmic adaptor subunit [Sphingomonas radiodurans]WBH15492.1 efflux RND transporter periplasmic adaptor subunit [Sphingomonas radiodurans]